MGILNSVLIGKGRKSAGNITTYNRLGVSCFRQKPTLSPNYKPSVGQRQQQSVFRFFKANADQAGVKILVDTFNDAKPKTGKSQTAWNMFYQSFMPHIVAQKATIYSLPSDELINPAIFMGKAEENNDGFTRGVLGGLVGATVSTDGVTVDASVLDSIIDKANKKISESETPYSVNDIFIGAIGVTDGATDYATLMPTLADVTLSGGVYTITVPDYFGTVDFTYAVRVCLLVAKPKDQSIDLAKPRFAISSISSIIPDVDVPGDI